MSGGSSDGTTSDPTGSGSDGSGSGPDTDSTGGDSGGDGDGDSGTYQSDIELTGLEVNQGVAITIAEGGQVLGAASRNAALVPNREALVRAIYTAGAVGETEGRLTLHHADGTSETVVASHDVAGNSDLTRLGGTFEWMLSPEQVTPGVEFSVGLFVPDGPATPAPPNPPRIPQTGSADLGVPADEMAFELVLFEAGYPVDQSAIEPIRRWMYEMNPATELVVRIDPNPIQGDCLSNLADRYAADSPGPNIYYHGITDDGYGVAEAPGNVGCSGFYRDWEATTWGFIAHEVGHNHGSFHNPGCNSGGGAPYPEEYIKDGQSTIGTWGYGVLTERLWDPDSDVREVMSYCEPTWVSDFSWRIWHDRIRQVSMRARDGHITNTPPIEVLRGYIRSDGLASWSIAKLTHLPERMQQVPSSLFEVNDRNGGRVSGRVWETPLADTQTRAFLVVLPDTAEHLDAIDIQILGDWTHFDDPLALRARYDRFVRSRDQR